MNRQVDSLMGMFFAILLLAVAGVAMAAAVWLALWMLGPINRAAGALKAQTRFQLSDVLGLMVLLQFGLGIVGTGFNSAAEEELYWTMLAALVILAVVLWAASVAAVSRAGILQPLRRLTVTIVLVPGTLAAMMLLPALIYATGYVTLTRFDPAHEAPPFGFGAVAAATAGFIVGAIVIRRLSFWAIAHSAPPEIR